MSPRFVRALLVALLFAMAVAPIGAGPVLAKGKEVKARHYVVVDLGVLQGGDYSIGYAVNEQGTVAGMAKVDNITHAVTMKDTAITVLGVQSATSSANDINEHGQAVGFISVAAAAGVAGGQSATLWQGDRQTDIGSFGGVNSIAHGINEGGVVVGEAAMKGDAATHAFSWTDGQLLDLGTLGGDFSSGMDVNDGGQVVGMSTLKAGQTAYGDGTHATLWKGNAAPQDLGALGGDTSVATGINNAGVVVGGATTEARLEYGGPGTHAFLWKDGQVTDLGAFDGVDFSSANGINNNGEVVGFAGNPNAKNPDDTMTAAFWDQNLFLTDLNGTLPSNSGWYLVSALSISDSGQITGLGISQGQYRGFLLQPVN